MCGSLDQRKHTHRNAAQKTTDLQQYIQKPQVDHHPGRGMRTQIIKREEMGSRRRIPHHPCTEKGAAASPSCLLHRWNSRMHNNWVDSECQPPFNTPNEAQDPSYKKMQMVAQRCNDDGEAMADERGIGSRAELLLRLPLLPLACVGGISRVAKSRARCEPRDRVGLELGRYLLCAW